MHRFYSNSHVVLVLLLNIQISFLIFHISSNEICNLQPNQHKFYLLKKCQRSLKQIINLKNFDTLMECENFAHISKGLAFNFAPIKRYKQTKSLKNKYNFTDSKNKTNFQFQSRNRHILAQPEEFWNCHVLECPETENLTTIINDNRFDYYSLYTNPIPPSNSTCLPQIGIFQLYTEPIQNYSTAFRICKKKAYGALAHIVSEPRTNLISKLLKNWILQKENFTEENVENSHKQFKFAYIGLNNSMSKLKNLYNFRTSDNENLNCFLYRAWAEGHPKNYNSSCVAITTESSWKTFDCKTKLPFICEIYTSGGPSSKYVNNYCQNDVN